LHNKLQTQVRKIDGLVEQLSKAQAQKKELEQALKKEQQMVSNKWRVETRMVAVTVTAPTEP
jgi:hypothetical protein